MAKIVKNTFGNFLVILMIWQNPAFPLYPPKFLWNFGGRGIQEGGAELSTIALLTGILGLFILKIVNPPRAVFGPCGAFYFVLK